MIKELLSESGYVVFGIILVLFAIGIAFMTFNDVGPAGAINRFQADWRGRPRYYPALTVFVLLLPWIPVAFVGGLVWDRLTGQGPGMDTTSRRKRRRASLDREGASPRTAI